MSCCGFQGFECGDWMWQSRGFFINEQTKHKGMQSKERISVATPYQQL